MQKSVIQEFFFENLDTITCIAGIVFGIAITSLYLISATIYLLTLGGALTLASLLYLAVKSRDSISTRSIGKPAKILLEIAFFLLFSVSVMILHANDVRPLLYFVLITVSAGLLTLSILCLQGKCDVIVQIIKIFLISLNLKYSLFLGYYGIGSDYWLHLRDNGNLVQSNFIDILSAKEPFYPLMHIQVAVNAIITDTPIKDATNFAIIIPLIISSICIFLVARNIVDAKTGLVAMLITNLTDYHTYWGAAPQTTTYGLCLYCFFIFFIFRAATNSKKRNWLLITILFIPVLVLAHAVSSFIAFISILGLIIGSYIYKAHFDQHAALFPSLFVLLIYGIVLLQHWFVALYNRLEEKSFFEVITATLIEYVTEKADFLNRPETISGFVAALPSLYERIANVTGLTLLLFLSAIGCMFWLSKRYRSVYTFPMITCSVWLLLITFGFPLFGMRNIMPGRWFAFMYFFLSIMAAFALLMILSKTSTRNLRLIVCFVIISCLTLFMTTSTVSNEDSTFWLQETTISTAYTTPEVIGIGTLANVSERVLLDSASCSVITSIPYTAEWIRYSSDQQISNTPDAVFVWRQYMLDRPIGKQVGLEGYYKPIVHAEILGIEFLAKLDRFDKMYDNNEIQGYYLG